jgi:peptidoglycan/LPS O-acetylase OafA/YrhL
VGLLAAFLVASTFRIERTLLLLMVYALGLAGVAADAAGSQGGVSRRLAPWAQLSFSLYLLHPIALKMGINWIGVARLGPDRRRPAAVGAVLGAGADPGGLSVAGAVRAAGAGLDLGAGREREGPAA